MLANKCCNDAWLDIDIYDQLDKCFEEAGEKTETLYWAYMQCIYCDFCDISCARDAGSKNCEEYWPE
jgi:hypothetical protein